MSDPAIISEGEFLRPPTPGEILLRDFLKPLGLSQTALANACGIAPYRINKIVRGKRGVTAETDLRLTRYLGLRAGYFLGLQADHDLVERRRKIEPQLEMITPRAAQRVDPTLTNAGYFRTDD